jgi:nucleoside recognition membrane protein YjiH
MLALAFVFFSGILAGKSGWVSALDYTTLNGAFGSIKGKALTFVGAGGQGARAGFLFALSLIPGVMLALGFVEVVDRLDGLKAAQRLLTPILRPSLGIPGVAALALISSTQSTDAGAGMTKALYDSGEINDRERTIFAQFQFSGAAVINNFLSIGSALFANLLVPVIVPFALLFVLKLFGANLTRLYLRKFYREELADGK